MFRTTVYARPGEAGLLPVLPQPILSCFMFLRDHFVSKYLYLFIISNDRPRKNKFTILIKLIQIKIDVPDEIKFGRRKRKL